MQVDTCVRCYLRFSPPSFEARNPEDKPAEVVAELLNEHGVTTVVLNACNSGHQPLDSNVQSLAYNFISKGIAEVVAMSFAVMKTTAADFMTAFYKTLLHERSATTQAVYQGRKYLRKHTTKEGRFLLQVEVQDDFLPVLYQRSHSGYTRFDRPKRTPEKATTDASRQEESSDAQAPSNMSLLGRENDLLAIETALSEKSVVKVIGDHGVGKTCLANRLFRWWRETGFVDHIFAVDFTDLSTSIVEAILKQTDEHLSLSWNSADRKRVLVSIDNFDVQKSDEVSNEKKKAFNACVARLKRKHPQSMWLLFCNSSEDISTSDEFSIAKYSLDVLRTDEAAQLVRHGLRSEKVELSNNHEANEQLEEFLDHHNGNPLALELLGSLLPSFGSFRTMLQALEFGLPPTAWITLGLAFHKNNEMRNMAPSKKLKTYFNEFSNTLYEFEILMEALKGHSKLAFQIALSLAIFQKTMPFELQNWVAWLFRSGGPLSNCSGFDVATSSVRKNEVPTSKRQEPLREPFKASAETQQCVTWVLDQIKKFGFITLNSLESSELTPKYFEVHPLLPYLLRFEIIKHEVLKHANPNHDIPVHEIYMQEIYKREMYEMLKHTNLNREVSMHESTMLEDVQAEMKKLPFMLWQMYEARIASLMDATVGMEGPKGVPQEVEDFLESERENIYNAVKVGVQQPEFGYQTMHVLGMLFSEANTELYPAQARAQARLLDCVLSRVEALYKEQNFRSALARSETADALAQIMMLTWWRGNTLLGAEDHAAALDNTTRGLRVLKDLARLLPPQPDLRALRFALQCQAASVPPTSGSTHALQQLLAEERPSGLGRTAAWIFGMSMFLVRTRYLQARGGAAGPDGLSFKDQAALYVHTVRGSELSSSYVPNHDDLLSDLEDENLDEKRWSTKVKPALAAAFVKFGYEFPYSSAKLYLWRADMLKTDVTQQREALNRAVEVAERVGDLKAQISGLDELFLLVRGEDIGAAIKIHERLIELERDMKSRGLDWERTQTGERHASIGVQFLPSKDTDPNAGDLYGQARPYFRRAIEWTQEAIHGIYNVKVKHIKVLYQAHMGLRRCGNFAGDHNEYVSNTLRAVLVDHVLNPPNRGSDWGQGKGTRWVLQEYEASTQSSTGPVFIAHVAEVIKWDAAMVLHFLLQCMPHQAILLREESREAQEETQRILFGIRGVDTAKLKYWRRDEQAAWTLDASKLEKSNLGSLEPRLLHHGSLDGSSSSFLTPG